MSRALNSYPASILRDAGGEGVVGPLDFPEDFLPFSFPDRALRVGIALREAALSGGPQFANARETTLAKTIHGQVAEEAPDEVHPGRGVGVKCRTMRSTPCFLRWGALHHLSQLLSAGCLGHEFEINKERAMRRRALRKLLTRLSQLQAMELQRDQILMKIGEAKAAAGRAYHLVDIRLPAAREAVNAQTFTCKLNRARLRIARRREGRYLLHSSLSDRQPVKLWELYIQLTQVEEAFKNIKGDPFGCAQGTR